VGQQQQQGEEHAPAPDNGHSGHSDLTIYGESYLHLVLVAYSPTARPQKSVTVSLTGCWGLGTSPRIYLVGCSVY
jgi:hypothetical protein